MFAVDFPAADLVEERHHDERVEDDSKVLGRYRYRIRFTAAVDVE